MALTRIITSIIEDNTIQDSDISSSFATSISGSSTSLSSSVAADIAANLAARRSNTTISGSTTSLSSSIASDVAANLVSITNNSSSVAADVAANLVSITNNSSSFASRYTNQINQDLRTSASPTFVNTTVTGTLTAQEIHTEFESASILFTSGSTRFGDSTDDKHRVTGSMEFSGSLSVKKGDISAVGLSLSNNDSGTSNTILGKNAGLSLDAGSNYNVFIGEGVSDASMNDATLNTGIGYTALSALTTGDANTAVGALAGEDLNTGLSNTLIGREAGKNLTDGDENVIIGDGAGQTTTGVHDAVIIGRGAAQNGNITTNANGTIAIGYKALEPLTSGAQNTAVGFEALKSNTTGEGNVAIGYRALDANVAGAVNVAIGVNALGAYTGSYSVAVGREALRDATGGNAHTAIGLGALAAITDGVNNTALGYVAGNDITTGNYNTLLGYSAGSKLISGGANVAIGNQAMLAHETGGSNIAIGHNAMVGTGANNAKASTDNIFIGQDCGGGTWGDGASSNYNTAVGNFSMDAAMDGAIYNTALGFRALGALTSGDYNLAAGKDAGLALTTGAGNVFLGNGAGSAATGTSNLVMIGNSAGSSTNSNDGAGNVLIGKSCGNSQTDAANITAIGYEALTNNVSGDKVVAIGYEAAFDYNPTANYGNSVFVGYRAGYNATTARKATIVGDLAVGLGVTTGHENTVIGHAAGYDLTAGSGSTFVGLEAGANVTDGNTLIAIGYQAMSSGNTRHNANDSIAIGTKALYSLTTGNGNICIGAYAGYGTSTGAYNTVLGEFAGQSFNASSTWNTLIGYYAGRNISGAGDNQNVCVGGEAGDTITSGLRNLCLGTGTDTTAGDTDNAIVLGYNVTGGGNELNFGKSGNVVSNTFTSNANFSHSSDKRLKREIKDNTLGLNFINELETKTYKWLPSNKVPKELTEHYNEENQKDTDVLMYGMLAQDVKEAMNKYDNPEFTGWNEKSDGSQNISREMFVIPLIKAVQELSAEIENIKKTCKCMKEE